MFTLYYLIRNIFLASILPWILITMGSNNLYSQDNDTKIVIRAPSYLEDFTIHGTIQCFSSIRTPYLREFKAQFQKVEGVVQAIVTVPVSYEGNVEIKLSSYVINQNIVYRIRDRSQNVNFNGSGVLIFYIFEENASGLYGRKPLKKLKHKDTIKSTEKSTDKDIVGFYVRTYEQWPAVTWDAKGGAMDIFLNNVLKGSTKLQRGIEPGREHSFVWKKAGKIICQTTLKLDYNEVRTCKCDEKTGEVSIQ